MTSDPVRLAYFGLCVALVGSIAVSLGGLYYFRRVRLERPAVGTFNWRDVVVLFVLLGTIPLFYVHLPRVGLTTFLAITFITSLSIGFRPVLPPAALWLAIGTLIGANLWIGRNLLGTVAGWQVYWVVNSLLVILGAIAVANLYVQGGMKLKHVAWFALVLAAYDAVFTTVFPVTIQLVEAFLGFPLDPSVGMRWGFDNAAIGIGDLLVYALFAIAAFKAYGRVAGRAAFAIVVICGVALPSLVPLVIDFVDPRTDVVVPAQAWFGPTAFLCYLWMRRHYGPERTMREFLASDDVVRRAGSARPPADAPVSPAPTPPPDGTLAAPVSSGTAGGIRTLAP